MTEQRALRGAIVGFGQIASQGHVPAYLERAKTRKDVEIVAVADISEGRRQVAQQMLPDVRVYTSADILFDEEAGNLDFVDIAVPSVLHSEIAIHALENDLHVLCEKPLATTLEEAQSLSQFAREKKRVLFPSHHQRFAPAMQKVKEILDSGRIGRVCSVSFERHADTHPKGVQEWKTDWRREKRFSGGGIGMDWGPSALCLAFEWMGSYPTSVTAHIPKSETEIDDNFSAVLTFPTGLMHLRLSWTAGVRKSYCSLQGKKGAISIFDDEVQVVTPALPLNNGSAPSGPAPAEKIPVLGRWMDSSQVPWFSAGFDQFKKAIETQDFFGKEAIEASLAVQVIATAYRSAADGCRELPLPSVQPL